MFTAPDTPGRSHRWWGALGIFCAAFATHVLYFIVSNVIAALAPADTVGGYTTNTPEAALLTTGMVTPAAVASAAIEEIVLIGVLVVLLRAAGRPMAEAAALAVIGKVAIHAYYGLPALALVPGVVVLVVLYWRAGRLWPLICAHAAYNLCISALTVAAALLAP